MKNYLNIFKTTSSMIFKEVVEYNGDRQLLFSLLNKFVSIFTDNFQVILFLAACISIIPIAVLYKKESDDFLLTASIFLTVAPFSMFFSGLKQSIAMGIVVLSFVFIKQKKPIYYILCIILAMLFHKSAIFCFLLYPLYHINITKKSLFFIIPGIILLFIFRSQVFSILIQFVDPIYQERYNFIKATGAYSILVLLILFCIYCFTIPDKNYVDSEFVGLRNFLLLATCVQCFASINPVVMRINYYILLFIPILIPKVSLCCKKDKTSITVLATTIMKVFFVMYFFYNGYFGADILNVFPYVPFWQ